MGSIFKWVIGGLILLHGLIHLLGGVNELGWASVSGLSGKTLIALPTVWHIIFGILWLLVTMMFLTSLAGLALSQSWWRWLVITTAVISQLLIVIWWPDAKAGTIPNAILVLAAFLLPVV